MWLDAFWSWWVVNREDVVPFATLLGSMATLLAGAIGLWLLYIRTRAADRTARAALDQAKVASDQARTAAARHDEQTRADRERRITESFAKAVEQLGSDKLEIRLGGIYALERIASESDREYWPIMETLTAFVRERAPGPPWKDFGSSFVVKGGGRVQVQPATDIQAVLTVLGRRDETARKINQAGRRLELGWTDLRGADLAGAYLKSANLWEARLEGACLRGARLEGAELGGAHLEGADLSDAHLEGASLCNAYLAGTVLSDARLDGALLSHAHLDGAFLGGAHLQGAKYLLQSQVEGAMGDEETMLPPDLTPPAHWSTAPPDDTD